LGAFGLYLATLAPTVTFWDSGELITAAYGLGISHQPGYPLYSLVGRAFSLLPFGSVAYRLNLLSAFFSALAVFIVYHVLLEIFDGAHAKTALSASLTLFLCAIRVFWSQAVVSEVYALNSSFVALLVLLHMKAAKGSMSPERYLPLSGFVFGLGVINHMSLILYLPALALSWALTSRVRGIIIGTAFIMLGLSVYIYLPIRSHASPMLDIGHPDNWPRFWWVIKWGEYIGHAGNLAKNAGALAARLDKRVIVAALAGLYLSWRLMRMGWRVYLPPLVFLAVYALGISALSVGAEYDGRFGLTGKFFIPAFMLIVIFIGAAARDIMDTPVPKFTGPALAAAFGLAALFLIYTNYRQNDYSKQFVAYDYAQDSLKSVAQDGVLITWGDNGAFPLWYLHGVERYRDDAVLVHAPLMTYDWYLRDAESWLRGAVRFGKPYYLSANVERIGKAGGGKRRMAYDFSARHFLQLEDAGLKPYGLVYYEGQAPPGDPWRWYASRGADDEAAPKGAMDKNIVEIYRYQRRVRVTSP